MIIADNPIAGTRLSQHIPDASFDLKLVSKFILAPTFAYTTIVEGNDATTNELSDIIFIDDTSLIQRNHYIWIEDEAYRILQVHANYITIDSVVDLVTPTAYIVTRKGRIEFIYSPIVR